MHRTGPVRACRQWLHRPVVGRMAVLRDLGAAGAGNHAGAMSLKCRCRASSSTRHRIIANMFVAWPAEVLFEFVRSDNENKLPAIGCDRSAEFDPRGREAGDLPPCAFPALSLLTRYVCSPADRDRLRLKEERHDSVHAATRYSMRFRERYVARHRSPATQKDSRCSFIRPRSTP